MRFGKLSSRSITGAYNTPVLSYTTNLNAWYKYDAGVLNNSDTAAALNDTVKTWQDQSGNGYDLSQATDTNRPLFKTSHLEFDGSDNVLLRTTDSIQTNGGATFILWEGTASASGIADLFAGGNADGQLFRENGEASAGVSVNMRVYAGSFGANITFTYGNKNVTSLLWLGASAIARNNGVQVYTGNVGTSAALGLSVGAARTIARPWKGKIREVLNYSVAPAGADLTAVETYLLARKARWV
jgi:hypothetical protein